MKILLLFILLFSNSLFADISVSTSLFEGISAAKIDGIAKTPVLVISGRNGFVGNDYFDVQACNEANEACAIIPEAKKTTSDLYSSKVMRVSKRAAELGIKKGMIGKDAIMLLQ